jgi:putative transposase
MPHIEDTRFEALLHAEIPRENVSREAWALRVVQRVRKIDVYTLVITVILAVTTRGENSLANLHRAFQLRSGTRLARSAFWDRFTPAFEHLVRTVLDGIVGRSRECRPKLPAAFRAFRDVVVIDATVMKVDDALSGLWRGCRSNSASAAIKIHTIIRAFSAELLRYRITPEAFYDGDGFGTGPWMRGLLFLFDQGYASPSFWARIHHQGGYFLSRLPPDRDPLITRDNRRHRGRARTAKGRHLRNVVHGLKRALIDVQAEFRIHVRRYGTPHGHHEVREFRVVGVRNRKNGDYHLYVTNAPPEALAAEVVRDAYRLRWETELFYKAGKSGAALHELPSAQPHIVRTLVYAALIRTTLAMKALNEARDRLPLGVWINPIAWQRLWNQLLAEALDAILEQASPSCRSWSHLATLAVDPNRGRRPTRASFMSPPYAASEAA